MYVCSWKTVMERDWIVYGKLKMFEVNLAVNVFDVIKTYTLSTMELCGTSLYIVDGIYLKLIFILIFFQIKYKL